MEPNECPRHQLALHTSSVFRCVAVVTASALATAGLALPSQAHSETTPVPPAEPVDGSEIIELLASADDLIDADGLAELKDITLPTSTDEDVIIDGVVTVAFSQPGDGDVELTEVTDDGTLVFEHAEEDFNTYLQVLESPEPDLLSDGVRALIEIESATAPREYPFETDLPDDVRLEVQDDGSVLGLNEDDEVLTIIPAPWAFDAEGYEVATWYEARDEAPVQVVDVDTSHAFPIVADPVWFVILAHAGRVVLTSAIRAATWTAARSAAIARTGIAAARIAVQYSSRVVNSAYRTVTATKLRSCGLGALLNGAAVSYPMNVSYTQSGRFIIQNTNNGRTISISAALAGCVLGAANANNLRG